jgi:hypothetical protein
MMRAYVVLQVGVCAGGCDDVTRCNLLHALARHHSRLSSMRHEVSATPRNRQQGRGGGR